MEPPASTYYLTSTCGFGPANSRMVGHPSTTFWWERATDAVRIRRPGLGRFLYQTDPLRIGQPYCYQGFLSSSRHDIVSIFEVEEEFFIVEHIAVAFQPGLKTHCYVLLNVFSPDPNGYLLIWLSD